MEFDVRKLFAVLMLGLVLGVYGTCNAAGGGGEKGKEGEAAAGAQYVSMESVIVNLAGRRRYLRADIKMLVSDAAVAEHIKTNMPAIRHSLIMLFSGRDPDQVAGIEERERLRQSAKEEVRKILAQHKADKGFEDLFFTDFMVQ